MTSLTEICKHATAAALEGYRSLIDGDPTRVREVSVTVKRTPHGNVYVEVTIRRALLTGSEG